MQAKETNAASSESERYEHETVKTSVCWADTNIFCRYIHRIKYVFV